MQRRLHLSLLLILLAIALFPGQAVGETIYLPVVAKLEDTISVYHTNAFVPYEGSDSLYIVGEVLVNTKGLVNFANLTGVLRDANGATVAGTQTIPRYYILSPGMKAPFLAIFTKPPAWTTYELFITSWSTTTASPIELTITNTDTYFDTLHAYHVFGTIKNPSEVSLDKVTIFVTLYDSYGDVIGVDQNYPPLTLSSNQETQFDVDVFFWKGKPDHSQVATYSVRAFNQ